MAAAAAAAVTAAVAGGTGGRIQKTELKLICSCDLFCYPVRSLDSGRASAVRKESSKRDALGPEGRVSGVSQAKLGVESGSRGRGTAVGAVGVQCFRCNITEV